MNSYAKKAVRNWRRRRATISSPATETTGMDHRLVRSSLEIVVGLVFISGVTLAHATETRHHLGSGFAGEDLDTVFVGLSPALPNSLTESWMSPPFIAEP